MIERKIYADRSDLFTVRQGENLATEILFTLPNPTPETATLTFKRGDEIIQKQLAISGNYTVWDVEHQFTDFVGRYKLEVWFSLPNIYKQVTKAFDFEVVPSITGGYSTEI